jgi:aspartate oxidase
VVARFPVAVATCAEAGLDITRDPLPVAPAAHYFTGGIRTDTWGRTTVPRLYAAGECASTGLHGANRLASNSLAEALVFGERAAEAGDDDQPETPVNREPHRGREPGRGLPLAAINREADEHLEVDRSGAELETLAARLAGADDPDGHRSATLIAWLLAQAALRRTESRGGHYRTDHPARDDRTWRVRQLVTRDGWSRTPV